MFPRFSYIVCFPHLFQVSKANEPLLFPPPAPVPLLEIVCPRLDHMLSLRTETRPVPFSFFFWLAKAMGIEPLDNPRENCSICTQLAMETPERDGNPRSRMHTRTRRQTANQFWTLLWDTLQIVVLYDLSFREKKTPQSA